MFNAIQRIDTKIAQLKLAEKDIARLMKKEQDELERLLQVRKELIAINTTCGYAMEEDMFTNEINIEIAISRSFVNDLKHQFRINELYIKTEVTHRAFIINGKDKSARECRKNSLLRIKEELKAMDNEFVKNRKACQTNVRQFVREEAKVSGISRILSR